METTDVKSGAEVTESIDQIITNRSVVESLLQAVTLMQGEAAAQHACKLGDKIESVSLLSRDKVSCTMSEVLGDRAAIVLYFTGDMCQQQFEELIKYDELLALSNSEINIVVVTPNAASATSCVAQAVMEDEPIFDDKSNLIFDMELSQELEAEEVAQAMSEALDEVVDDVMDAISPHYTIYSEVNGEFSERHRLSYALSGDVCKIFERDLSIDVERRVEVIPAIYIVGKDGVICYSYLNSDRYVRPEPRDIIEYYRHFTSMA